MIFAIIAERTKVQFLMRSAISKEVVDTFRTLDEMRRLKGTNQSVLYKASLGIAQMFYEDGHRIELECPSCGNRYEIGKEQFKIGADAYQKAIKTPDVFPEH